MVTNLFPQHTGIQSDIRKDIDDASLTATCTNGESRYYCRTYNYARRYQYGTTCKFLCLKA
ncbi:hypothetical protein DPMN_129655 [Dreissena polymorpha]|uniref:Uncharacterized protein n=1 Tax=Dreissena polymorpha TaxID=45954 RepID=A0A9D4H678_DREPO|nr:hypothetical protein DPMN_129655 [Dreissena polymorpha]